MVEKAEQKPDPPKKPLTAFFIYKKDQMDVIRDKHAVAKLADITKIISKNWNESKKEIKFHYEKKAAHQKKLYLKEKQEYLAKYGKIEKKVKPKRRRRVSIKIEAEVDLKQENQPALI
jgi:HMG (high mobility group) box